MKLLAAVAALILVAGCSSPRPGGYYKDDGPHANPPADLDRIADAVPRAEPLHRYANRPYRISGRRYVPLASLQPFRQRGMASWYGKRFHGRRTASGEPYDMYAMTAAHPTLPIPSYVRVTHLGNGRSVVVRINDRGPFHAGRIIDLSYVAAYKLGYISAGSAHVEVESIVPGRLADAEALYLQLGAFASRDNAERLRARVESALGSLSASAELLRSEELWRVRIGPYRSRELAASMARQLEELVDIQPLVVR